MNKKLVIFGIIGGLAFFALALYLVLNGMNGPKTVSATLQFWGVYDEPSYYADIISQYEKANPGIKIAYKKFNYDDYEKTLVNSMASGDGPDMWLMHNTWLPKHNDKIAPLPQTIEGQSVPLMTLQEFKDKFVDAAREDLVSGNQIYGLPLYVDTLGLYYNKDIFNSAGIAFPPATWDEFNDDVVALTKYDAKGHIARAGAAIGTTANVNRSSDILMLLMMQSGVRMTSDDETSATFAESVGNINIGETALRYYTDFANPSKVVYTWDSQQHYSVDAFVEGKAAMMINYSHQILTIHSLAPRFNFTVAPMPQIKDSAVNVNFANYWAATVSKQSKYPVEAWKFLVYLTNTDNAMKYLTTSKRPAARRDLIDRQQSDSELGVFAKQSLSARSWHQVDNAIIETIFNNMIDSVNYGRSTARDALSDAEGKVNVLMIK